MAYDFSANDVFEMAVRIEENGALFYREAAASGVDDESKIFLLKLAAMEDKHQKTFFDMKNNLTESETANTVFDPHDENLSYLKALADVQIFFKKEIDITSMESILKAAIMAEKDSIVFYLGLKGLVPGAVGGSKLDDIISEEMNHIKLLSHHLQNTQS